MAQISDLTPTSTLTNADEFIVRQGGEDKRVKENIITNVAIDAVTGLSPVNDGIWDTGFQFTTTTQYMVFSGIAYRVKADTTLPHTVGATPDLTKVVKVPEGTLFTFDNQVAFIDTLPSAVYNDGDRVLCEGRTAKGDSASVTYQITSVGAPVGISTNWENLIPVDAVGLAATLYARIAEGRHITNAEYRAWPTEIIAHRGFNFLGVEGTLSNYSAAMKFNPDALEGDCQFTSDGEMVLWHDNNLDALTNGTGEVKNNTLAQVQSATFNELSGTYLQSRIHIGKVEDLVRFAKKHGVRLYIEIKKFRTIADISLLVDLIVAEKYEAMTNLSSFQIDDVVEVRRLNKRINVGWLTSNINTAQELIDFDKLQRLKWADVLHQDTNLIVFPSLVDLIYNAGVGLASWGIQYSADANALLNVGVPRIITDQPITSNIMRGLNNVNY